MSPSRARRPAVLDSAQQHRGWLSLVEVSGPFLSLPVLRATWPALDPLDKPVRERLRREHALWLDDPTGRQRVWCDYVLRDLLGWADALHTDGLENLTSEIAEHDTVLTPSFALVNPGEKTKPDTVRLLGTVCPPGQRPTSRIPGSPWAATPVDRLAQLCRHHGIELGLATDGRWWALVWAPRGGVTSTAVFDAVSWAEAADRDLVRAFVSLLCRHRFFAVPDETTLVPLLRESLDRQEDITDALGVQVRQAVELLVTAIGRADVAARQRGEPGLEHIDAHEVYHGAATVMMRVVFLLFAEERGLLPADNELYLRAYSAGRLCAELEQQAREGSEDDLEHSSAAWHRLLALFGAVYHGVEHPRLRMHPHDGSLFDPDTFRWLQLSLDDRTVLHMLRAVQHVTVGRGRNAERRTLSFRTLDVEQIGYVYEGLLSFEGYRADQVVVGLVGKAGLEEEVPLADLESLAVRSPDVPTLAAAVADTYKDSKIGSSRALEKLLAPLVGIDREEARKRLLAVTGNDWPLAERLLPFIGLLRADLRGLPVVILPGALYVTESALRRNTGTHYTPRSLAEEVVKHALQPLVYSPGPLQTADRDQWQPITAEQILALKVADIAMGSAAFLVAAARYLGDKLLDAWLREGHDQVRDYEHRADKHSADADRDPVLIEARRQVIEHCLYGVDINPMAVEMAKLSLWLVSMDPTRPFTFVDDRLVCGDSLLGITNLEQLDSMHMDPKRGREIHHDLFDWTSGVRSLLAEVASERQRIAQIEVGDDPLKALAEKRSLLADADLRVSQLRLFADLAVGAALAYSRSGDRGLRTGSVHAAQLANEVAASGGECEAHAQRKTWLDTDRVDGSFSRSPLHWPLVFPEVFARGGFNAVIGNPPFLGGQKLTGLLGTAYREYLVHDIGRAVRGSADLVAYFVLRAHGVLGAGGQTGLLATNTLAQGDTREVGLDQLVADGVTIRRAIKSKPWPSKSAVLEYCAVWTSGAVLDGSAERTADGQVVSGITPSLDSLTRVTGSPHRLAANGRRSFQGSNILGLGFTMEPEQATALIAKDPHNADVLFPYLNGQDVNSDPGCVASRWVINFHDWPEDKAKWYPECFEQVCTLVKPGRDTNKRTTRRDRWWQFAERAPELYAAITGLKRAIVLTRHSKAVMPAMVPAGQIFSDATVVFATDDTAMLALLSSASHYWWTIIRASSLETRVRYTPSDVFETLPLPEPTQYMRELGDRLNTYRRNVMLSRRAGLTKTYNLVHDPACTDADIVELRAIHKNIDEATVRAYGWDDLFDGLDHGFHPAGRETRYTIGPAAQREILDRLLELNHRRHAEEVAAGMHDKGKKRGARPLVSEGELRFDA
ncbi:MAG TPA: type IIL restriction-modification enzyme MmeI [Pseudonocardiaceae bacterium]|nr:type IIL restriction-modification enzyme MmeI [Pseudonocardiaceae bacterium]